jgi:hypothetical protein
MRKQKIKKGENDMNITIKNCNNIDEGTIAITENRLNIKYALNGTGKSTVAKAIINYNNDKEKERLIPFKYRTNKTHMPEILGIPGNTTFEIFNEDYVNQYVFQQDELVKNSFEIFIKTPEYERHQEEINNLIGQTKNLFQQNESIQNILTVMQGFLDGFKATKTGYSGAGSFGKSLAKGNKIQNIPSGLECYMPYLQNTNKVSWLRWQLEGQNFLEIADACPFCSTESIQSKKATIEKVKSEFEPKYIEHLDKMVKLLTELSSYLIQDAQIKINEIKDNISGITKEQTSYLLSINQQIETLKDRLIDLQNLGFNTFKDVDDISDKLGKYKIDLTYLPQLNTDKTAEEIKAINDSIDIILTRAGLLKGEINKEKQLIIARVKQYSKEINDFLRYAGYSYTVHLEEDEKAEYKLKLYHKDYDGAIVGGKTELSYGERNAFALVLFMYDAIKKNPDIIILDDPISSFDGNKKFAILNKLFMGSGNFNGKTVILLTHEFDTVLDVKKNLPSKFQAETSFLCNENGYLIEREITGSDIVSFRQITLDNIHNLNEIVNKIVYLRRLLEFEDNKNNYGYHILANVIHKREIPTIPSSDETSSERNMTDDEETSGLKIIKGYIPDFDYDSIIKKVRNNKEMIAIYKKSANGYEKLQIYRILFDGIEDKSENSVVKKFVNETFHIENDYLYQLNPCKYEVIPDYVIAECNNNVEELEKTINA